MEEGRVLIADKMHLSILTMLEDIGWKVNYALSIDRKGILDSLSNYQGLIIRSKTAVDRELITAGINLKFVGRAGAGIDKIDINALEERGVPLINAPEGNRNSLGEHTLGMLLSLMHNLNRSSLEVKSGIWKREANRGMELRGKTVGIYGYGYMGSAFAEKLFSMDCRVIAYDRYKEELDDGFVQQVSKEHFEKETEILSIHVPLTSETRGSFDLACLRRYKKLKFLLNTARGEVLDLDAVVTLLSEGELLGAALDVLENEKLDKLTPEQNKTFEALVQNKNVLLTPHIAGWTHESYERINKVIVNKMIELGLSINLEQTSKN